VELVINIALRSARGERMIPVSDMTIAALYGKMPEEVMAEIIERIDGPVNLAYERIGMLFEDDD